MVQESKGDELNKGDTITHNNEEVVNDGKE